MRYMDVEDTRIREYLKKEIVNTIIKFCDNERLDSIIQQNNYTERKGLELLPSINNKTISLYETTSDNILDTLDSEKLISAISYLEDDEIDLLTRLYVNDEDEYEIALEQKTSVKDVHASKLRILDKIEKFVNCVDE